MALHGEIKVNNRTIGSWEAVRKDEDEFEKGLFRYECEVRRMSGRYDDVGHKWEFSIWHKYDDGAIMLAAKVLAFTDQFGPDEPLEERTPKPPPEDDDWLVMTETTRRRWRPRHAGGII